MNLLIGDVEVHGAVPAVRALAKITDAASTFDGLTYHVLEGMDGDFFFGCIEGNESLTVTVGIDGTLVQHWNSSQHIPNDTFTERTILGKFQKVVTAIIDNHDISLMQ